MIASALKERIERYSEHMDRESPLFRNAREGRLTLGHIQRYLESIHFLIQHTPVHLSRAEKRARDLGRADLAGYFRHKQGEEEGHDSWAEADLKAVQAPAAQAQPAPSMVRLVRYVESLIDRDPSLYLSYILMAEYFTVLRAPAWLEDLERNCGIPRSALSVVDNHAVLDRDHVSEAMAELDELATGTDAARMLSALEGAMERYAEFCSDVGAEA